MGRKKASTEEVPDINELDKLTKEIVAEFGEGVFIDANMIKERRKTVIPVSPAINYIFGGGISSGSWVTFTGRAKLGKTTTALHFAAKAQRPEYGGRTVYYIDAEGRLKNRDISGIPGLDLSPDKFVLFRPTKIIYLLVRSFYILLIRLYIHIEERL
jgi:predicted ATP-dependent serine protease